MSQEKMKFKKRSLIKDYLRLIGKRTRVVIESSGILGKYYNEFECGPSRVAREMLGVGKRARIMRADYNKSRAKIGT